MRDGLVFTIAAVRLMDMILPNVFQAAMKQSNLLPLPFNISAFSDWPFPDRPADRFFLIPLYGFVMVDVGRKFPGSACAARGGAFFKTMNFLRFVDVFKHRLFLLTEKIADSQFFYAKVDPDRFSSQFSVQPVWHLIAKAYIPIFAIKRNSRIRIMTAFRNLRERLSSPHETDFLTVKAAVFACKAFIVCSTLQLLKHNKNRINIAAMYNKVAKPKHQRRGYAILTSLYTETSVIGRLLSIFSTLFPSATKPTRYLLTWFLIGQLALESAPSVRCLYRQFLSRQTDKA